MATIKEINKMIEELLCDVENKDEIIKAAKKDVESLDHLNIMDEQEKLECLYFRIKGLLGKTG